jgi:RNA polymerase sigma-70 factor (family 1)
MCPLRALDGPRLGQHNVHSRQRPPRAPGTLMHPSSTPAASTPSSKSPDGTLVERIRRGEPEAFEQLFREFWHPLCRFAYCYVSSTDDAEEVVQTVFARLWRNHDGWSVPGTIHDYLYLATRNVCLDRLKRERVSRSWSERRLVQLKAAPEFSGNADSAILNAELAAAIERAFAELPEKRRRICELRLAGHLRYAEVARMLRISPKTVETQLARGLKQLRSALEALRR